MLVKYLDNDGGNEIHAEEVKDVAKLLAILNSRGKINLRWPNIDSFWFGKFDEAVLDIEFDAEGNRKEELILYFDLIDQK